MTFIKVVSICILGAVLCLILKQNAPQFGFFLSIFISVSVLYVLIMEFLPFITYFGTLAESSYFSPYVGVIIKACGIGILTRLAADICKDAGEAAFASKAELAGKTAILLLSLPIIKTLFESIKEFMN